MLCTIKLTLPKNTSLLVPVTCAFFMSASYRCLRYITFPLLSFSPGESPHLQHKYSFLYLNKWPGTFYSWILCHFYCDRQRAGSSLLLCNMSALLPVDKSFHLCGICIFHKYLSSFSASPVIDKIYVKTMKRYINWGTSVQHKLTFCIIGTFQQYGTSPWVSFLATL